MSNENKLFLARIDDLISKASGSHFGVTSFLTPEEEQIAKNYLSYCSPAAEYAFYGGYPEAERKILVLFPDFADKSTFDPSVYFCPVRIENGGYSKMTHSSCLGALMNCSIERSSLGDICVLSDRCAIVFALKDVAKLLVTQNVLERVGRDKVTVEYCSFEEAGGIKREYEEIFCTVASQRLDCLVSEIANTSREKAKLLISQGDVARNHISTPDASRRFETGDTVSVRGEGKFTVGSIEATRKGRLRVQLFKYK